MHAISKNKQHFVCFKISVKECLLLIFDQKNIIFNKLRSMFITNANNMSGDILIHHSFPSLIKFLLL